MSQLTPEQYQKNYDNLELEVEQIKDSFLEDISLSDKQEELLNQLINKSIELGMYNKAPYIASLKTEIESVKHLHAIDKELLSVYRNKKYFAFDSENFTFHDTYDEALNLANSAIEDYRERLADYGFDVPSDGNFSAVSYGIVLGKSNYKLIATVTEDHHKALEYTQYELGTEIYTLDLEADAANLVNSSSIELYHAWQDSSEPENIAFRAEDVETLGDCYEVGDLVEIDKFKSVELDKSKLWGTWTKDKKQFFIGSKEECQAILEAQDQDSE
ncbi:hypothetical protein [Acinetobacter sp. HY1485]|uniref:hypothetical protein n=1 Tax=Acinetobacter sp. HY1485 TaxID=2970918 RepID=UPI0022B99382|nr:hypothetical protein [Acinetobacter sp. HY1485]